VSISIGIFVREEKALELSRGLVVSDHNAVDRYRRARDGCGGAVALNVVNEGKRDIIVVDRALALRVTRVCARDIRDVDKEGLVGFDSRITIDGNAKIVGAGRA